MSRKRSLDDSRPQISNPSTPLSDTAPERARSRRLTRSQRFSILLAILLLAVLLFIHLTSRMMRREFDLYQFVADKRERMEENMPLLLQTLREKDGDLKMGEEALPEPLHFLQAAPIKEIHLLQDQSRQLLIHFVCSSDDLIKYTASGFYYDSSNEPRVLDHLGVMPLLRVQESEIWEWRDREKGFYYYTRRIQPCWYSYAYEAQSLESLNSERR